jgi:hypothetical protein
MKKLRLALAECFELASVYGITTYLMWDRHKNQWFVGTFIIPVVHRRFDIIKKFKA